MNEDQFRTITKNSEDVYADLSSRVHYDRETGKFFWKRTPENLLVFKRRNMRVFDEEIGYIQRYRRITFRRGGKITTVLAHRLAWYICYNEVPVDQIDHINQNKLDNRIENLRSVSCAANNKNKSMNSRNSSGVTGVCWSKGKWRARVGMSGKTISIGRFESIVDAQNAIEKYRNKNGFTQIHGQYYP